jgi:hypothetical protein
VSAKGDPPSKRTRYTISLTDDEATVVNAVAALNGYAGRPGAWIGDQVRIMVTARRKDAAVQRAIRAKQQYQASRPDRVRHGFGVIDGGG